MIPFTFPSSPSLVTGNAECKIFYLSSVVGMRAWTDYIPVRSYTSSSSVEGTTDAAGYQSVKPLSSTTGLAAWTDYIPVYEDASLTKPWSTDAGGYIPVGAAGSRLSLNFAGTTAIDSRITYSGGSSRTFFGSDGLMKVQGYNRLTYSSTFTNAAWTKTDVTPTLSDSSPLDAGYLMTEGSAGNAALLQTGAAVTAGSTVTESFVAKRGNTDWIRIRVTEPTGTDGADAYFNLNTGVKGQVVARGAGTSNSSTITSLGGGWYRCTVTSLPNGSYTQAQAFIASSANDGSGTRVANATYYISAAQLEAGSTASQYSPTTTAANSAPRLDYDPATLLPRGLLIEEQRTNSLLHSRDMTQAAWTKTDVTAARTQAGIDGVANSACLMTEGSAGTSLLSQDGGSVTAGSTVTNSFVLKRGNTDWVRILCTAGALTDGAQAWFNLATGAKGAVAARGAGTNNSSTITSLGGGWYRCTVTTTPNGAYTIPQSAIISATADSSTTRVANATYIVDCAQLEVGSFATSPIITGAATATRSADSASMTGTNLTSWINTAAGTFVAEADTAMAANQASIACGVTASNPQIYLNNAIAAGGLNGVYEITNGFAATNSFKKIAYAYSQGDSAVVTAGGTPTTSANATAPSAVTILGIGSRSGSLFLNGHIKRLSYYPTRLPNATLQALTA